MMKIGMAGWQLWADASTVVWLRSARLMQGGKLAENEARQMVSEKLVANATFGWAMWPLLAADASPERLAAKAIRHYQKPVGANRKRLMAAASRGKA